MTWSSNAAGPGLAWEPETDLWAAGSEDAGGGGGGDGVDADDGADHSDGGGGGDSESFLSVWPHGGPGSGCLKAGAEINLARRASARWAPQQEQAGSVQLK